MADSIDIRKLIIEELKKDWKLWPNTSLVCRLFRDLYQPHINQIRAILIKYKEQSSKSKDKIIDYLNIKPPRGIRTPYILFRLDYKDTNHNLWKTFTPEQRQEYIDRSKADKQRYEREMNEYKQGPGPYYNNLRKRLGSKN